jgi:hypothetical protein
MPIQINEFEIMVDEPAAPKARGGGDSGESAPQAAAKIKPEEIVYTTRVNRERMERLRAD